MPKRQKQRILYTMVQISDRQTNILRVLRSMYNQSGTTVRESMRRLRRSHHKSLGKVRLPANAPTFFFCVRFFVFSLSFLNHMDGVTPPPSPFLPFFHNFDHLPDSFLSGASATPRISWGSPEPAPAVVCRKACVTGAASLPGYPVL